ncbi:phosphate-starvation-inducible protein PsiE [Ferrimonas balearica]|uniref:phosphate-starvation-inducible protein PsiE n=1 Tax=Ferrimonas balearica TaxID=44012 RepID=UPI001C9921E1|nr:phosphate-starvation-inducible PsiE family protein [Ferrimonas balearica]MBY5921977.1 phosphate-starvation-inducible PsiE family protein [Ferrimonas balearica]MBY5994683.1 phosphate-starvation-inducible PsiE family protein [Ferrimonas balearica]
MKGLYQRFGSKSLKIAEHGILIIISIATLFAIFEEVMLMFNRGTVELGDLLLLFIYLEVLAMVANYAEVGKLPIRMPIYIAIVALARYLILDMKSMDDWRVLAIAFSALVLAAAVIVIRFGQLKLPYPKDNVD